MTSLSEIHRQHAKMKESPPLYIAVVEDIATMEDRGMATGKTYVSVGCAGMRGEFIDCGWSGEAAQKKARELCETPDARNLTLLRESPFLAVDIEKVHAIYTDRQVVIICFTDQQWAMGIDCPTNEQAEITCARLNEKLQAIKSGNAPAIKPVRHNEQVGNVIYPAVFRR